MNWSCSISARCLEEVIGSPWMLFRDDCRHRMGTLGEAPYGFQVHGPSWKASNACQSLDERFEPCESTHLPRKIKPFTRNRPRFPHSHPTSRKGYPMKTMEQKPNRRSHRLTRYSKEKTSPRSHRGCTRSAQWTDLRRAFSVRPNFTLSMIKNIPRWKGEKNSSTLWNAPSISAQSGRD